MKTKITKLINWFTKFFKKKSKISITNVFSDDDTIHMTFTVPIKGLSETDAAISELMTAYKEEIKWNEVTGEVNIDILKDIPYLKNFMLPTQDNKSVNMELHALDQEELIKKAQIMYSKTNANLYKEFIVPKKQYQEIKITEPIEPEVGFHKIIMSSIYGQFDGKDFKTNLSDGMITKAHSLI